MRYIASFHAVHMWQDFFYVCYAHANHRSVWPDLRTRSRPWLQYIMMSASESDPTIWPATLRASISIDCKMQYITFFHHYQGSIDFNTVNVHRTVGMYFLVSTGNRGDIEWHDLQRSYYPIHSLLPGVYVSILSLGTVFPRTLPMANIRNTSSRGKHWQCSSNDAE